MVFHKKHLSGVILLFSAFQLSVHSQTVHENLKILEPMLGKKWTGELKTPEGSVSFRTYQEYTLLWDGTVIKFKGSTPEINSTSEGYFYWDRDEQKIAVFIINSKGIYNKGFVSVEDGCITMKGIIHFPERKFDFKNTFEFTSGGGMIDRWFQNAFGPWRPGHVVELTAESPD
jgi:hypothetical protein